MLRSHRCSEGISCCRRIVTYLLISHTPLYGCWNRTYRQKAHELRFPTIRLPNRNVVKFSYTNRKHFIVGDLMAFHIVKMGNKNPKTSSSLCTLWTPSNKAMPRPPSSTTANCSSNGWGTGAHVRRKFAIGYNGAPKFAPKSTPSRGPIAKSQYLPHPWTRLTYDAKRLPDLIRHFATMPWTDWQNDWHTDIRTDRQIVHVKVWRL